MPDYFTFISGVLCSFDFRLIPIFFKETFMHGAFLFYIQSCDVPLTHVVLLIPKPIWILSCDYLHCAYGKLKGNIFHFKCLLKKKSTEEGRSWFGRSRRKRFSVVFFVLGDSLASEFYVPTFRNALSVPSFADGTEFSETSEHNIRTQGNHLQERLQCSQHGKKIWNHGKKRLFYTESFEQDL